MLEKKKNGTHANTNTFVSFEITSTAEVILGIPTATGKGTLICSAEEVDLIGEKALNRTVIALYSDNPKQAYACRAAAYDYADACLTLSPQTAARLKLLHPNVLLAESVSHALELAAAFEPQHLPAENRATENGNLQQPMTILFVTHDFRVGGLEQVVIDIAALAKKMGHRPIISYAGIIEEITRRDLEKAGIEHERLPEGYEARKNFLRERNVSLVNAHYATILAQESHELTIPYLQTIHNMYLWLDEAGITQWRELDQFTAGYIAVSANAAMVADLRLGLPPEKMVVIPNGVAITAPAPDAIPERDDALRAELGIPADGIVFVQVASLNGVKAHLVAIEAVALALKQRQDIYLVLLGKETDPNFTAKIRERICLHNLEKHVLLPGYRKDVHRFLNLARAMVAPSFVEGWSLAISEALQLGVPVIATDVGGACEQFRGTENILLPSYFEDVANLSASDFFAALTDEHVIVTGAHHLATAMVQMASRAARKARGSELPAVRRPEEAYVVHLEIMRMLLDRSQLGIASRNGR